MEAAKIRYCVLLLFLLVTCLGHVRAIRSTVAIESLRARFSLNEEKVMELRKVISDLSRQVMLQQYFLEEKTRSDGNSGVKVIRGGPKGLMNFESNTHSSNFVLAIHDHSNYERTVGMGEFAAVLNGYEFRTRHNDYKIVMPSTTSEELDAVEDVRYPDVPPRVLEQPTVQDQVLEMREWFRAFWTQNTTHRDYTPYFRPIMVYLEGAWTLEQNLTESFSSDRHALDAESWFELQEKSRFSSYSGVKERFENLAILPTTIMEVNATSGKNTYAQWNYRILAYPINGDLPFKYLQQVEDLSPRISRGWTRPEVLKKRCARFKLYRDTDSKTYQLLDEIMYSIPGKDNSFKNLSQSTFRDGVLLDFAYPYDKIPLDTSRYHRWYKTLEKDAMGLDGAARGYNDDYCFVAQTTQPSIAALSVEDCIRRNGKKLCMHNENRFSYAIPLEIMYLTPLLTWNPYNLKVHKNFKGANVDGRDGDSESNAFDGVDLDDWYLTPAEFYSGTFGPGDPADTVKNTVYVRGQDGNTYKTCASGPKITLPEIPGIGRVRCRFPIAPIHGEGSSVWKELNALREMLTGNHRLPPEMLTFEMSPTSGENAHLHTFEASYGDFLRLINDKVEMHVVTDEAAGHRHSLVVKMSKRDQKFWYVSCDGESKCSDGHPTYITMTSNNIWTELPHY